MTMQTDVKSIHATSSGVVVGYRTRLKGAIVSPNTSAASRNTVFANNVAKTGTYDIPGSTICTVSITNRIS